VLTVKGSGRLPVVEPSSALSIGEGYLTLAELHAVDGAEGELAGWMPDGVDGAVLIVFRWLVDEEMWQPEFFRFHGLSPTEQAAWDALSTGDAYTWTEDGPTCTGTSDLEPRWDGMFDPAATWYQGAAEPQGRNCMITCEVATTINPGVGSQKFAAGIHYGTLEQGTHAFVLSTSSAAAGGLRLVKDGVPTDYTQISGSVVHAPVGGKETLLGSGLFTIRNNTPTYAYRIAYATVQLRDSTADAQNSFIIDAQLSGFTDLGTLTGISFRYEPVGNSVVTSLRSLQTAWADR
jgi:hypothetical protein